jgi:hypothetical protein
MGAGTGFMLIKREVIEQIIEANPQILLDHQEHTRSEATHSSPTTFLM